MAAARDQATASEPLIWSVWPAAHSPLLAALALAAILAASLMVQLVFLTAAYTALSLAFLTLALAPFLLPTSYRLDATGVEVSSAVFRRARNWDAFRGCHEDGDTVLLSPFSRPHPLAATRGLYLRLGANRQEVLQYIRQNMETETDAND